MRIKNGSYHILLVIYCLIIFILSSIPGENFPKVDFEFSDKIVHVIIYSVLYVLFFYSLKNQSKYIKLRSSALWFSLLLTSLYGMTDEFHQYFVTNRSCEFYDWAADTAGALLMFTIFSMVNNKKMHKPLILIFLFLTGCGSSEVNEGNSKPAVVIESAESWLDFMPVVGDNDKNRFGFVIKLKFTGKSLDTNYTVSDFRIMLNNDTLRNKRFNTQIESYKDSIFYMNLYQAYDEKYLDKNKEYPEQVEFAFKVNRSDKLIKTFITPKINILKTQ